MYKLPFTAKDIEKILTKESLDIITDISINGTSLLITTNFTIRNGSEIKFISPVDCSKITNLVVHYPNASGAISSKTFAFSDAHRTDIGTLDHLFAKDALVHLFLDVTNNVAYCTNADTNSYIENRFNELKQQINNFENIETGLTSSDDGQGNVTLQALYVPMDVIDNGLGDVTILM